MEGMRSEELEKELGYRGMNLWSFVGTTLPYGRWCYFDYDGIQEVCADLLLPC